MTGRGLLRWIDGMTPRGPARRILVDSRTPLNYEMVAPVVAAMAADPRIEFAFTASEAPGRVARVYQHAPAGSRLVGPVRAALGRWDVYLTSDFMWAALPRGAARVQMFHGVAGKYGFDAPSESLRAWDRLFFVNARRLRNVVGRGAIDAGSPAARLIGMPKVDALVDGSLRRAEILGRHGLDPGRPTVLYGPTWSPASSLNRLGVDLVRRLAGMPVNLIVKLHDRSYDPRPEYSGGVDWPARLAPLLSRPHTRLARGGNITPYLAAADVMITDHSSAGFEFLLRDRPLIRIELPELIERANVHPEYVRLLAEASHNVRDADEAVRMVAVALEQPQALSPARRAVAGDLFYRPGTATARAAAALYELLEMPAPGWISADSTPSSPCLQTA